MVPLSIGGFCLKFLYRIPFQKSPHFLLQSGAVNPCFKAIRSKSKITTGAGVKMDNAVSGNTEPRDHLQVTASHQRDPDIHEMRVIKIRDISPTVKKVVLHTDVRPVPFLFKAGQWVDVFIPGVETVGGFSMTSSPTHLKNSGNLDLAVKYSERSPASWVHKECKEKSPLSIRVGGNFFIDSQSLIREDSKDNLFLFIAGGVGINPICSMVAEMRDLNLNSSQNAVPQRKSVLLFSAKTPEELLFQTEFDTIAEDDLNFTPFYYLTGKLQDNGPEYPSNFKRSRIDHESLHKIVTEHLCLLPNSEEISKNLEVYICGPPSFIKCIESSLVTMGVKKIFFENWWQ